MIKKILFSMLVLGPMILFSQENKPGQPESPPTVYLIGAIHNMHFNPENHYSVNDLMAQIDELKPDLVCGEITPEAFNQSMEGYFPPEAAYLAEMAEEMNYRFVPVDWRLDYATQTLANKNVHPSVMEQRSALLNNLQAKLKEPFTTSLYDRLHEKTVLNDLDSLYEKIIRNHPLAEIGQGSWQERNRRIVENGWAARGNARTIVFVFGLDHLPQIQRQFKALGVEAKIPQRLFVPGNHYQLSKAGLERWKRNLENLISIRDKKVPATYDNWQKVMNSNRIQDLQEAIQKSL